MEDMIVLYQSKYGTSKRYAEWIAKEFSCKSKEVQSAGVLDAKRYQTFVICGGVYARIIAGLSFVKKYYEDLRDKKIIILAVGASAPSEEVVKGLKAKNLKPPLNRLPLFYLRGTWIESEMTVRDRMIIRRVAKIIEKDEGDIDLNQPWVKTFKSVHKKNIDWVDIGNLKPVITYLHENVRDTLPIES